MKFLTDILHSIRDIYAARFEPEGVRPLSDVYWKTLLVLAFLTLIGVFFYGTWGLLRVLEELGATNANGTTPAPPLNRAALTGTLRGFEERQAEFERLKTSSSPVNDPSR